MSSGNVDKRVVEMQFKNKQFEKGIKESTSSLDKFKKSLKMDDAADSTSAIQKMFEKIDLSKLQDGVERISSRFTNLGIVGTAALQWLANQAINTGERLVKSMSIDQIASGYMKMDQLTTATQTLRASGYGMAEISAELDRLMSFSDETSYSFTDMTSNLAKFTAQGLKLGESATALRGISAWAASAGQNSQTASRAMYNISQALGAGKMMTVDWKSIELANMATMEFKQAALEAAVAAGKLTKQGEKFFAMTDKGKQIEVTAQNFRDTLTYGWFDNATMMAVFQRYGSFADLVNQVQGIFQMDSANDAMDLIDALHDLTADKRAQKLVDEGFADTIEEATEKLGLLNLEYDELARKSYKAAQEAKTFNEAIEATKDAVSSKWMKTFQLIFGDYEQQKELWTGVANRLWDIFAEGGDKRNELLEDWSKRGGTRSIIDTINHILDAIYNLKTAASEAFRAVFSETTSDEFLDFTAGMSSFTMKIKEFTEDSEKMKSVSDILHGVASVLKIVWDIAKGIGSIGKTLWNTLFPGTTILDGLAVVGNFFTDLYNKIQKNGYISSVVTTLGDGIRGLGDAIQAVLTGKTSESVDKLISKVNEFFGKFSNIDLRSILLTIGGIVAGLRTLKIIGGVGEIVTSVKEGIGSMFDLFVGQNSTFSAAKFVGFAALAAGLGYAINAIAGAISALGALEQGQLLTGGIGVLAELGVIIGTLFGLLKAFKHVSIRDIFKMAAFAGAVVGPITDLVQKIGVAVSSIAQYDPLKQITAFGGITVMLYALLGFVKLLDKIQVDQGKLATVAFGFTILSYAINNIAKSVVLFGGMDIPSLAKGIGGVGFLLLEVAGFMQLVKKVNVSVMSMASLILVGIAMQRFADSVATLGTLRSTDLLKGIVGLGAVLLELVLFMQWTKKIRNSAKTMRSLIVVGYALSLFADSVASLGSLSFSSLVKGIAGLGAVLLEIILFLHLTKNVKNSMKTMLGLVVVGQALSMFASSLSVLGSLSFNSLAKGIAGLGAVLLEIILFMQLTKNVKSSLKTMIGLMFVGVALKAFASSLAVLGGLDANTLLKGVLGLAAVLTEIVIFMALAQKIKGNISAMASLMLAGVGLRLFAASVASLGSLSFTSLAKGIAGLGALLLELILFMQLTKNVKSSFKTMVGLAVVGVAVSEFASAISKIALIPFTSIGKALLSFGAILTMLTVFSRALGTTATSIPKIATTLVMLVTIVASMAAFSIALNAVKDIDAKKIVAFGVGFAAAVGAISLTIGLLGRMPITASFKALASFSIFTVGLLAVVAGLGALSDISPNLGKMLAKGAEVFAALGAAVGSFFGGIGGGVVRSFNDQAYGNFGDELTKYGKNIAGISDAVSSKDMDVAKTLGNDLADLYNKTNTIPNAVANLINSWSKNGGVSLGGVSTDYGAFGTHLKEYATAIKGISTAATEADFEKASEVAETLRAAQQGINTIPSAISNLINSWVNADAKPTTLADVSTDYGAFGENLKNYAKSISGIAQQASESDFAQAKVVTETLKAAQEGINTIPSAVSNLINSWVNADAKPTTLADVSTDYGAFGENLKNYAKSISGIAQQASESDFAQAKVVAETLEAAQEGINTIPSAISNLINSWVNADAKPTTLATVSTDYGTFGTNLKKYAESISGIATVASDADFSKASEVTELLGKAQEGADTIPSAVAKLINSWVTGNVKASSLTNVSTEYGTFGTNLKTYAESISGIAEAASDADFSKAEEVATKLAEAASASALSIPQQVANIIGSWLGNNYQPSDLASISTNYGTFGTHLQEFATSISGISSAATDADFENAIKMAGELTNFIDQLKPSGSLWDSLSQVFGSGSKVNTLLEYSSAMADFGANLKTFVQGLSGLGGIDSKLTIAQRAFRSFSDFVKELDPSGSIWEGLGNALASGSPMNTLLSYSDSMSKFGNAMINFTNGLKTVEGAVSGGMDIQYQLFRNVGPMVQAFSDFVTNYGNVASGSNNLNSLAGNMGALGEGLSMLYANLSGAEKFGELKDVAGTLQSLTSAAYLADSIYNQESAVQSLVDMLNAYSEAEIPAALQAMLSSSIAEITIYKSDFEAAGKNLAMGFANGVDSNEALSLAASNAAKLGKAALDALNASVDNRSPSHLAYKAGAFFNQGFANGIRDYADLAVATAKNTGKSALAAVLDAYSGGISLSDVDSNPTITPVMDLTNVRAGASTISDIFNTRRTLSASVTAGRIASQMRGGGNVQNITNNYYNNQNQSSNLNVGNMRMENEMDARALASEMDLLNRRARRGYGA